MPNGPRDGLRFGESDKPMTTKGAGHFQPGGPADHVEHYGSSSFKSPPWE